MISNCLLRKNKTVTHPLAEISEAREEEFTSSLSVGDGCYMVDLGKYVDLSSNSLSSLCAWTLANYFKKKNKKNDNNYNSLLVLLPWLHQPVRVCRRRRVHPAAAPVVPRMQQTVCRHETSRGTKSHGAPDLPPLWQLLRMDEPVRWRCFRTDGTKRGTQTHHVTPQHTRNTPGWCRVQEVTSKRTAVIAVLRRFWWTKTIFNLPTSADTFPTKTKHFSRIRGKGYPLGVFIYSKRVVCFSLSTQTIKVKATAIIVTQRVKNGNREDWEELTIITVFTTQN